MMLDWNDYQKQLMTRIGDVGKLSPETLRGYQALSNAAAKHGATQEEVAEGLGVAIAVNAGAALVYLARVMDAFSVKTS